MRLIEAFNLEVDESTLTGESQPVSKRRFTLSADTPMADHKNMAYMGTAVTRGGSGHVVETGSRTIMGQIATMKGCRVSMTPCKKLDDLGKVLIAICIVVCMVVAALGIYREKTCLPCS